MDKVEFGEYLRKLRKDRSLTMDKLKEYSGVSNSYIANIETGSRGIPSPAILRKLAAPLGVSFHHLMVAAGHWTEPADYQDLCAVLLTENLRYKGVSLTLGDRHKILMVLDIVFQGGVRLGETS